MARKMREFAGQMSYSTAWPGRWILGLVLLLTCLLAAAAAPAQMLRPARAVYDLQLNQNRSSAGIDRAQGRPVGELIEPRAGVPTAADSTVGSTVGLTSCPQARANTPRPTANQRYVLRRFISNSIIWPRAERDAP